MRGTDGEIAFSDIRLSDSAKVEADLSKFAGRVVPCVGSGAWRLSDSLQASTGALIERHREPLCVWTAIEYLLSTPDQQSAYRFDYSTMPDQAKFPISDPFPPKHIIESVTVPVSMEELSSQFPMLLVNIKTGSSFYRINSPTDIVRVGGSSIGASTINALGESLIGCSSLAGIVDQSLSLVNHSAADLLVEDIYGGDCESIGLPGSIIASCFGKATRTMPIEHPVDIAKSVVDLMCINTAQLTHLHAALNKCKSALIVGNIGEEPEAAECIQRVLNIRTPPGQTPLTAVFFKQSRFLGCLGALLRRERLVRGLSAKQSNVPVDTATVADGVDDETYTKLRVCTSPPSPQQPSNVDIVS